MFSKILVFLLFLLFSLCDQQLKDDRYDNRPLRVSVSQVNFLFPFVKNIYIEFTSELHLITFIL